MNQEMINAMDLAAKKEVADVTVKLAREIPHHVFHKTMKAIICIRLKVKVNYCNLEAWLKYILSSETP